MKSALVIVDVQKDFCPGGALAVPEGNKVVGILNRYIKEFLCKELTVFASRDWHPEKTRHFKEYGGKWQPHCIKGTKGAEFHERLKLTKKAIIITKGDMPQEDSYSAFEGRIDGKSFKDILKELSVGHLYVGGLATDYCVKNTVLDALRQGFMVTLLIDAVKGVNINKGDSEKAIKEMKSHGAKTITIDRLKL